MLTNKQLVSIKMRDLINLTGDMNRNSVSSMRYDDLLKLCGLSEADFLQVLQQWTKEGKLDFHSHVNPDGHIIHDAFIKEIGRVAAKNTTELWLRYNTNRMC